jgi:alpha-glucosidase
VADAPLPASERPRDAAADPAPGIARPISSASRSPFDGVVYQIYPRSFRDASGDGIGDLAGIAAGLDHLAWLGVDAVWLSPIYRSPMKDFGYDVSDHCDVDPVFGSLADLDALIAAAHERDLEVWLDFVPNHTSDQHPWFQDAIGSREAPKRDWYVWRDPGADGGAPNNWTRHFADGAPAWTFEEATGQYYLHHFLPEQPDVNWANPELREAMLDVLRFWMARGVDGFRADVIHMIGKSPELRDDPIELQGIPRAGHHHEPDATFPHLQAIRGCLDAVPGTTIVGEVNLPDAAQVATYAGPDRLHLAFQFGLLYAPWEARSWRDTIRHVHSSFEAVGVPPTWVLSNHDWSRIASRAGGEDGARVAATLLFTLRGVPFLYMGDELGMADAVVPPERVVDPGGRDGCRAPLPWTREASRHHGWAGAPWLPWPPDPTEHSVQAQRDDERSILHLHRRLIALRRDHPSLRSGAMHHLDVHDEVIAFERGGGTDVPEAPAIRVLANLGGSDIEVEHASGWRVVLTSDLDPASEGGGFSGSLPARSAVVLEAPVV